MIALLLSARAILVILQFGGMMRHNDTDIEKKYESMTPKQQDFYDYFSKNNSKGMKIKSEDYNGSLEVKAISSFADTEYDSKLEQYAGDGTDGWWIYKKLLFYRQNPFYMRV